MPARKVIGEIYRTCNMPVNYVLGFRKKPEKDGDNRWMASAQHIRSKQYVLVIDELGSEDVGNEYYRAFTEEGLYWIHGYDLVDVDHVTGSIAVSSS